MEPKREVRLFVGIPLPDVVRQTLGREMAALARTVPRGAVRWVPEANLHLTLKFLGGVGEERVAHLSRGLASALSCWRVMPASLEAGVMLLPGARRPRVVAAGVAAGESLLRLAGRLEAWAENEGFPVETREFRPHITLGRVRQGFGPLPGLPGAVIAPCAFFLDRVHLYESRLTPHGARYIDRHAVFLNPL